MENTHSLAPVRSSLHGSLELVLMLAVTAVFIYLALARAASAAGV